MANKKKLALLTLHGMGTTEKEYYVDLRDDLISLVGKNAWKDVHFEPVYYQDLVQDPQNAYYASIKDKVDSKRLRKLFLFGISEAGSLEYSRTIPNSAYEKTQRRIFDALGRAYKAVETPQTPVVFIAQSLGGQVLSNYIWDAQLKPRPQWGVWRHNHGNMSRPNLEFRRLRTLRVLITTGCNIPIFVAGLPRKQRVPIARPNDDFVWQNYYDEDDMLGWPLQKLNPAYRALVRDHEVNIGNILTSWNPFSHLGYWTDKDVQKPLAEHLKSLLA